MPVAGTRNTALASAVPLAWETNRRLPHGVAAVLAALRFSSPAPELLRALSDAEWQSTLHFTDRAGLTLFLGAACPGFLPAWVRERIEGNLAANTERVGRMRATLVEIAARFGDLFQSIEALPPATVLHDGRPALSLPLYLGHRLRRVGAGP